MESVFTPYEGVVSGEVSLADGAQIMCDMNIGAQGESVYAFCGFQIFTGVPYLPVLGQQGDHPLWTEFHSYRVQGSRIAGVRIADLSFGANLSAEDIKWFIKRMRVFIRPYNAQGLEVGLNLELSGVGRKKVFLWCSDDLKEVKLLPCIFGIKGHSLMHYHEFTDTQ